jgi:hypothetical protein
MMRARRRRQVEAEERRVRVAADVRAEMDIGIRVHPALEAWSRGEALGGEESGE